MPGKQEFSTAKNGKAGGRRRAGTGAGGLELPAHRVRTQAICAALSRRASELGVGARMPTAAELCASLGASSTTLNHALNELERRGVLYRVRGVGIFVSPQSRRSVALLCEPSYFQSAGPSPFWGLLLQRAGERGRAANEVLSCHFALPSEPGEPEGAPSERSGVEREGVEREGVVRLHEGLKSDIESGRVSGVLAIGLGGPTARWIAEQGVPVVVYAGDGRFVVVQDSERLIEMGVAALAGQGCRDIALMTRSAAEVAAFRRALQSHGLSFRPARVQAASSLRFEPAEPAREETAHEHGLRMAHNLFGAGASLSASTSGAPDGVLITDDMIAHGALAALSRAGVRIGRGAGELKVATHANCGSTILLGYSGLTLLEFDPARLVDAMFGLLESLMNGDAVDNPMVTIEPQLKAASE